MKTELQKLQDQIARFQKRKFPKATWKSDLIGLETEAVELMYSPNDKGEWADVLIFFLGSAAKRGITTSMLIKWTKQKMALNKTRKWGKPTVDGLYHHVK